MPAAAVIHMGRALSGFIGCKGFVGGKVSQYVKSLGSTEELRLKLFFLSTGGESGVLSVAVKCVDIRKNTSGEGDFLDSN